MQELYHKLIVLRNERRDEEAQFINQRMKVLVRDQSIFTVSLSQTSVSVRRREIREYPLHGTLIKKKLPRKYYIMRLGGIRVVECRKVRLELLRKRRHCSRTYMSHSQSLQIINLNDI